MGQRGSTAFRFERFTGGATEAATDTAKWHRLGRSRRRGSLHEDFCQGYREAIKQVTAIVNSVVNHRGYYIPIDERCDIVQDAMLDLFRQADANKFATENEFCGFVRVIAHRRCVDWMRAKRKREDIRLESVSPNRPDGQLLAKERQLLGSAVLARLKKNCRDLFALHAGLGMTYGQIAEQAGRTEGALRTQAYECLKQAKLTFQRLVKKRPPTPHQAQRTA
jgi:RNA polymerase sigma factor (sigma-70 family)